MWMEAGDSRSRWAFQRQLGSELHSKLCKVLGTRQKLGKCVPMSMKPKSKHVSV